MTAIGKNTVSGKLLLGHIESLEQIAKQKEALTDQAGAIKAKAKSDGFNLKAIAECIKRRAMKPHDLQEAEATMDMYMHAIGMGHEPPLFRYFANAGTDALSREALVDMIGQVAPPHGAGDIILNLGGMALRISRAKDGSVLVEDVEPAAPQELQKFGSRKSAAPPPLPADIAAMDDAAAKELGRAYARDNRPIIDNPFPFGDGRRQHFDAGWREVTGTDGFGADED